MKSIDLLIHCDLEAVPMKHMPRTSREPVVEHVIAAVGQGIDVHFQSPPCQGYSRPTVAVLDEPPEEFASWGPRQ